MERVSAFLFVWHFDIDRLDWTGLGILQLLWLDCWLGGWVVWSALYGICMFLAIEGEWVHGFLNVECSALPIPF
jgi:heme A synthase